jgi:hypothetical protein
MERCYKKYAITHNFEQMVTTVGIVQKYIRVI